MKIRLLLFTLFFITLTAVSYSQTRGFGLGIIVGEPTGISAKYWLSSQNALDFGLGYSFVQKGRLHFHMDYLFHHQNIFRAEENFALYYGPGFRLRTVEGDDARLGARFGVGLVWLPRNAPVDVFVEIAPILDIIPATRFQVNAGLGFRFFFN
jgi:hypothetical protein